MTKKEMINEIYKQIYEVRFYLGFYCEGSKSYTKTYTPERAGRFAEQESRIEAQGRILLDLTDKLHINPVFKDWFIKAFDIGFNANSVSECIIPDNLVDKD
jgi:hypothetical protein